MTNYIIRRFLGTIPVILIVMTLVFTMIRLIPGDPVRNIVAGQPVSDEVKKNLREKFSLDDPIHIQYFNFMRDAFTGDFGISYRNREPVTEVFLDQLPATLRLSLGSIIVAVFAGGIAGLVSGLFPDTWTDTFFMSFAVAGISIPTFYSGILLILFFSVMLGWFPITTSGFSLNALILPSITNGLWAAGNLARLIRSGVLEVMNEDYIRTARAKGLKERIVVLKHAFRNAFIPVVTMLGLQLALFFGGAAVTETVFARQGIGKLLIDSVLTKDYPVVQFGILFTTAAYIYINFAVDLFYAWIDPRVRYD